MKWKSIDTANKDGSNILLLVGEVVVEARWGVSNGDYNNPTWCAVYGRACIFEPNATHWMPKPTEPID